MNQEIFKRVEKKYLLTEKQYEKLLERTKEHLEKDKYYKNTICNVYFDTDNYDLIVQSLEKPTYKLKIRLRSYNVPHLEDQVFLEIKNKYKGIVWKRRVKISLKDFYNYLETGTYYDKDNKNFRITFDKNIRSREEDLNLEYGDAGKLYFKDKTCIMELKTLDALPLWFTKIINELKIYPTSFSKYGKIYLKNKKEAQYV